MRIIYQLQRIVVRIPAQTVLHHHRHRIGIAQLLLFGRRQLYDSSTKYLESKLKFTHISLYLIFQAPNSNNNGAPPVPQRHSSMRNSNGAQATVVQHQTFVTTVTPNSTRTVTRFVMDLEAKFGHSFHNVTEFPPPQPFTKFEKSYPSQNMKATTGTF